MAAMTGSMSQGRKPMKSGSIALMSIAGVIGGTWMMFRLMAPQRGTVLTTNEEMEAFRGGDFNQTDVHGKTARAPRSIAHRGPHA
ncbi:uncharacterized protein N7483_011743 [Penicillium malachiteum]|uniref:uncharacterized protein n=1 Tax=Penicillium malachiteum TaxID=1324776 RepID=UPI002547B0FE|nr:uncharacterized protein N7483_011743 [Penicillium malachiteum]KAJ5714562.1 hypothetical protein N7483_011743 [Penicillium malachiteum]